ncbi:MAG: tetratricopeptide repeat protein [candidate division Zixibacteria bacterium]|nr:tetratricopeptide repeat protein [candidate division Zixibacteria bacterium]
MKLKFTITVIAFMAVLLLVASCADKNLRQGKIILKQTPPDHKAAIEQFKKSLATNPNNAEAHYLMGKSYAELEDIENMSKSFTKSLEISDLYKTDIQECKELKWVRMFNKGLEDTKKENYNPGLEKFEISMIIDDSKYESYSNAGFVATKLGLDDKAYEYNKKAYDMKPDNFDNVRNYAATCYKMGKYEEALKTYKAAMELNPEMASIQIRIGQIYEQMEDYQKAADSYAGALAVNPDNSNLWFNLGVLYFSKLENNVEAVKAFAKARELNPEDIDAGFNQVLAMMKIAEFDKAAEVVHELEKTSPDNCDVYDLMISVYAELNDNKMVNESIAKSKKCKGE